MKSHNLIRVVICVLPLVWILMSGVVFGDTESRSRRTSLGSDFGSPIAKLGTPDKSVEIFRLSAAERSEWSYLVVSSSEEGTRRAYGDEASVGKVLESLREEFRWRRDLASRCPSALGWRFEQGATRARFCAMSIDSKKIERAVELLDLIDNLSNLGNRDL